ncbi:TetR/AcrR family transcriptional regulator [Camelliibacillus cellulosilyticus]|uniref:TetR/AcrR family transcriptional regulator n=1 Tax=Camelliibacillus cellulosilyticus TaxID=2174486 RepID=A0ABV9GIF4_9BACL
MNEWDKLFEQPDASDHLTEKQKRIIEAAIETFASKGFSGSSTNEIAKKAGVAEGTIFRHYKTKKDLLLAIVTPVMSRLIAPFVINDLNKVLDQDFNTFEAFLRAMVTNRKLFVKKNISLIKILVQEIPFHPELKALFIKHVGQKVFPKLKKIIVYFQDQGQIAKLPPYTIIRLAMTAVAGYVVAANIIDTDSWQDDEEMEQTIQFILNGVRYKTPTKM